MAHPLQRAATRRKLIYLGVILGLFTVSLFWRGKLDLPGGTALARMGEAARTREKPGGLGLLAGAVAQAPIAKQAEKLELRELDQGEAEIGATALRLGLVGSRGLVITVMWKSAIDKQRRHEFHEFEALARGVTRLQPHFIYPWLFQGWNIAYNVSVENDKLGDMFFYIARGIELLTEGDRLNTRTVTVREGSGDQAVSRDVPVGSPDLRHHVAFYYQNKFGVSDKVSTLRSIMQLAAMPPGQRDPNALRTGAAVNMDQFRAFCQKNPQLVRRLRTKLQLDRPEQVVQFLDDNYKVPCRFTPGNERAAVKDQFPALPPKFPEGEAVDEYNPESTTDDTFDAFHAARAWYRYSVAVVPPPEKDPETGQPMPWSSPAPGSFDEVRYRMPRSPAYIIFRQYPPRAQTYLAERLAHEGWFDEESAWDPDERPNPSNVWFPHSPGEPPVLLKTPARAREEWSRAYAQWKRHGEENGLTLDPAELKNLQARANRVPAGVDENHPELVTAEDMRLHNFDKIDLRAKKALRFHALNRSMTNFPYFLSSTQAEQDPQTVDARRRLFQAEELRANGDNLAAVRAYVEALGLWHKVLARFPDFHHQDSGDRTDEETYEYMIKLNALLRDDRVVQERAEQAAAAVAAVVPLALHPDVRSVVRADYAQAIAEDEGVIRVALLDRRVQQRAAELTRALEEKAAPAAHAETPLAHALAGTAAAYAPGVREATYQTLLRGKLPPDVGRYVLDTEFPWLKEYVTEARDDFWVRPSARYTVRARLGISREKPLGDN